MGGAMKKASPSKNGATSTTVPNQRWELVSRPNGLVSLENFALRQEVLDLTNLTEGEAIVQCEMLSVDAFLRTMLDAEAYHGTIPIGGKVPAFGYGTVIASANPKLPVGKRVMGLLGACLYAKLSKEEAAMAMPMLALPGVAPRSFLGLLGLTTGLTAWVGIHKVAAPPRRGQTAVVSGAAGATGSVAAQLAKVTGAKVIGIAGGPKKQEYLLKELGLDGAVDYKAEKAVKEQLDELCPDGVDFFFDTVGGDTLDAVLPKMNRRGRIIICGASSQYNGNLNVGKVQGPSEYLQLAEKGASMHGYNVMFYMSKIPGAIAHMLYLKRKKKLFMTEQIEKGIDAFAPAMIKMFTGGHIGKLLVDVEADTAGAADFSVRV